MPTRITTCALLLDGSDLLLQLGLFVQERLLRLTFCVDDLLLVLQLLLEPSCRQIGPGHGALSHCLLLDQDCLLVLDLATLHQ